MSSDTLVNRDITNSSYSAIHQSEPLIIPAESIASYARVTEDDPRGQLTNVSLFLQKKQGKIYKQYGYRWVVLINYFFVVAINGLPYETCIPIAKTIHTIYEVSDSVISLTATSYMLMHPIFSFYASQIIVKHGFAFATKVGSLLTIIGLAVRLLVNQSFYSVLVGQILCGIGRPFILNGQASMAQNWFYPAQRTLVLTLANVVQTLSIVLSLMVPAKIVFAKYDKETDDGRTYTYNLMVLELLAAVLIIPSFFLLKSSPQTPPSAFANTDVLIPFREAIRGMFSNTSFVLCFLANSFYFGTLKGFGVVVPYLLNPYNFDAGVIALAGSLPIIGGMVSSVFISTVVLKVGKYKPVVLVLMIFSLLFTALFYLALTNESEILIYADALLLGFFLIPMIPVMIELSCEIVYPLSSSFAVGMLFSGATLFTVISSQLLTVITKGTDSDKTSILIGLACIVGILAVGLIMQIFVKEVKNRQKEITERKKQSTVFFQHTTSQSSKFGKFQSSDLLGSIGDLPTYYPFIDSKKMLSDPDVFNPDFIYKMEESIIKPA